VYDDIKTIADHFHYDRGQSWEDARFAKGGTDAAGGGHAHAVTLIYLGDSFPAEYRGSLLTHNIMGNRINRDLLEPSGSGYIGHHGPDFMKANDGWFRGLRLELGPDGSVFNSDWYDARACHQQQPHDRTNGRIYKISYGDTKPVQVNLATRPSDELVQLQLHANEWFVRRARLILQERGPDPAVHAALVQLLAKQTDVPRRLRLLWTLHVTRGLTEAIALELLKDAEPQIRGWTIQLTCEDKAPSAALLSRFAELARTDSSPVVRRFLASAAQRIAPAKRWDVVEALLAHGEDATDHNLPLLYWFAAEPLVPVDSARALALGANTPLASVRGYLTRRQAGLADEPTSGAANKQSKGIDGLVAALNETTDVGYQREILDSIMAATEGKTGLKPPAGWTDAYAKLSANADAGVVAKADALAARLGDKNLAWAKGRVVLDTFAPLATRQAALAIVLEKHDFQLAPLYQKILPEPGLRIQAMRGLAAYDVPTTPPAVIEVYPTFTADEKRAALSLLAGRPAYARELIAAVRAGKIPRADLDVSAVRQLRLLNDPEVDRAITEVWGVVHESPQATAEEIVRWKALLIPAKLGAANPSRGRAQFLKTCAVCHTLFGEGKQIGPELTGSNRADLDYILTNVVDPNAVIGKDYLLTTVETKDGRTASGILQRETPNAVTLVNPAESVTLSRDSIKTMQQHELSLMPPGLLQTMSEDEVADLIAYLRQPAQVALPK
jgi:putative heme-binding domain-containing protein